MLAQAEASAAVPAGKALLRPQPTGVVFKYVVKYGGGARPDSEVIVNMTASLSVKAVAMTGTRVATLPIALSPLRIEAHDGEKHCSGLHAGLSVFSQSTSVAVSSAQHVWNVWQSQDPKRKCVTRCWRQTASTNAWASGHRPH